MNSLQGKQVTVFGLGRSAVGAARLLLREGAVVFVTDSADRPEHARYRSALEDLGVPYETGGHSARAEEAAYAIASPGVPPDIPPLQRLRERGVSVIGELELGTRFCRSKMIAVTGTNGKTTTTEWLRCMIAACGRTVGLAGNNDNPLSMAVLADPAPEFMVLEVSSYQLETADTFHPTAACVLNLTPDHLGRHKTMEGYAAVKNRLFARQGAGDTAVLNADDAYVSAMAVPAGVRRVEFSLRGPVRDGLWLEDGLLRGSEGQSFPVAESPLPGRHNIENALAALALMQAAGFDWESACASLKGFRGVEHRIEWVGEAQGTGYFNDSKSTNIDSLRVALESFSRPVVLIAGGRGKGSDYSVLAEGVRAHVARMITLGEDAPKLEAAFGALVPWERAESMADAVLRARRAATPETDVLLSPGCASFDLYENFEERGRDFKACVRRLVLGEETR